MAEPTTTDGGSGLGDQLSDRSGRPAEIDGERGESSLAATNGLQRPNGNAFAERIRAFGRPGSPDDSLVAVRVLQQLARSAVAKHRQLIAASEADELLQGRLEQLLAAQRLVDEVLIPEVRRAEGVPDVR